VERYHVAAEYEKEYGTNLKKLMDKECSDSDFGAALQLLLNLSKTLSFLFSRRHLYFRPVSKFLLFNSIVVKPILILCNL
jgi:hypothetical protein